MFGDTDLAAFIDMAGTLLIENGWRVIIRAEVVDRTEQQPHGLDYAIILQNEHGSRILGYDNAHSYDGAEEAAPWDHEHRAGNPGQAFRYDFSSAGQLVTDFFDKLDAYGQTHGIKLNFISDDE